MVFDNPADFELVALDVFQFQSKYCKPYADWLAALKIDPKTITSTQEIPFLPIELFKSHKITVDDDFGARGAVFRSSGTTGQQTSQHYVPDLDWYHRIARRIIACQVADPSELTILALLPGYLERPDSSLINMIADFMECGEVVDREAISGFYINRDENFSYALDLAITQKRPVLIWGVTHSLVKWQQEGGLTLPEHVWLLETGGMKGHGREMVREELHQGLCSAFGKQSIMGEYGMTELLSQAYSLGDGLYNMPPSMRVLCRDDRDPFSMLPLGFRGLLNVIDLANVESCSFIATQDIGQVLTENTFKVLGRADHADVRGCNLLAV